MSWDPNEPDPPLEDLLAPLPKADKRWDLDLACGVTREDAFARVALLHTVEHKCDLKAEATGNVFIEVKYKGQWSGLITTEAEYWATEVMPCRWVLIKVDELKPIVRRLWPEKLVRGGDDLKSEGVLVPMRELVPVGQWWD